VHDWLSRIETEGFSVEGVFDVSADDEFNALKARAAAQQPILMEWIIWW